MIITAIILKYGITIISRSVLNGDFVQQVHLVNFPFVTSFLNVPQPLRSRCTRREIFIHHSRCHTVLLWCYVIYGLPLINEFDNDKMYQLAILDGNCFKMSYLPCTVYYYTSSCKYVYITTPLHPYSKTSAGSKFEYSNTYTHSNPS